jgi:protein-S-isoprenylcysteine O-methyltransferase Ste14
MMNSAWALALLPFVMYALYHLVIKREERYLMSAFPTEYSDYTKRVRRWL